MGSGRFLHFTFGPDKSGFRTDGLGWSLVENCLRQAELSIASTFTYERAFVESPPRNNRAGLRSGHFLPTELQGRSLLLAAEILAGLCWCSVQSSELSLERSVSSLRRSAVDKSQSGINTMEIILGIVSKYEINSDRGHCLIFCGLSGCVCPGWD